MKKNVASQKIGAQLVSASDGSAFTGSVTVAVTGDAGTQATGSVGSGACTHEGNGYHTYSPAQAETNYDLIAFTFTGSGAVPVTVQVFTDFPQTGDSFARLGAPAGASVSADIAAIEAQTDDIGAAGAGLTAVPWNAAWDAEVQSEVADALAVYDPPTKAELDSAHATTDGLITTVDGNVDLILEDTGTTLPSTLATLATYIDTEVAAILEDTGTTIPALIGSSEASLAADIAAVQSAVDTVDSNVDAILVDTGTTLQAELDGIQADTEDIQSRLPAALVSGRMPSDMEAISGDTTAADRLEALMDGILVCQVNDASATTTAFVADGFTEATNDHLNGRLITFISGALAGQQTAITDYVGATQTFTVSQLTEAPGNNDFFVIH